MATKDNKNPFDIGNPFAELTKMMEQAKLPGVDMQALIEARRADMNAVVEANKASFEAMQAMARKQAEMFSQAMQGIQATAQKAMSGKQADPAEGMAAAKAAYDKAVADLQELAQIAQKAQADTLAIVNQRAAAQLQEFQKLTKGK